MKDKLKKLWNDHKVAIDIASSTILLVTMIAIGTQRKVESQRLREATTALANALANNTAINEITSLVDEVVKKGILPEGTKVTMSFEF